MFRKWHRRRRVPSILGALFAFALLTSSSLDAQDRPPEKAGPPNLNGVYRIQTVGSKLFWHNAAETDKLISTRTWADDDSTRFALEMQKDGWYKIRSVATERLLHCPGDGDQMLSTRFDADDDWTLFAFEAHPQGGYRIKVKAPELYLHEPGDGEKLVTVRVQTDDAFSRFHLLTPDSVPGKTKPAGKPQQAVQVRFRNTTDKTVRFFLTGVDTPYALNAGESNSFGMSQKSGVVGIVQADGSQNRFTVEGGGKYSFGERDGKIVNDFDDADFIKLTIFNRTNRDVVFLINGGNGSRFKLPPNDGGEYSIQVDEGVPPQITVAQADGGRLNFPLEAGKKYVLRETAGAVQLALDVPPPAPTFQARFRNATNKEVTFFLSGVDAPYKLPAGAANSFGMPQKSGGVFIVQADGMKVAYAVEEGGKYFFSESDGKIVNNFDNAPVVVQPAQQRQWTGANPPVRQRGESVGAYLEWVDNNRVFNSPKIATQKVKIPAVRLDPDVAYHVRLQRELQFLVLAQQKLLDRQIKEVEENPILSEISTYERWRLLGPPTYTPFDTKLTTWKAVTVSRSQRDELKGTLALAVGVESGDAFGIVEVKADVEATISQANTYDKDITKKENFSVARTTKGDTWNLEWIRERVVIIRAKEPPSAFGFYQGLPESVYVFPLNHQVQIQVPGERENIAAKFSLQNPPAFYGRTPPRVAYFTSYNDFFDWLESTNGTFYEPEGSVVKTKMDFSALGLENASPVGDDGKVVSEADVRITMRRRWRQVENQQFAQGAEFSFSLANTEQAKQTETLAGRVKSTASAEVFGISSSLSAEIEGSRTVSRGLETSDGVDRVYTVPDNHRIVTWVLEREVKFEVLNRLVAAGSNGPYNGPKSVVSVIYLGRFDDVSIADSTEE